MGCAQCNQQVVKTVTRSTAINLCDVVFLQELEDKLHCLKMRDIYINTTQAEINTYLGLIETMRTLNDFCLYNLEPMYNKSKDVSC